MPKDMPRQLWYAKATGEYTFDITAWRLNAAGAPRRAEFTRPEDRLSWKVMDWPFRAEKK